VNLKQISFEFASGSNLGPSFQIALNSYPVLARRTPPILTRCGPGQPAHNLFDHLV